MYDKYVEKFDKTSQRTSGEVHECCESGKWIFGIS